MKRKNKLIAYLFLIASTIFMAVFIREYKNPSVTAFHSPMIYRDFGYIGSLIMGALFLIGAIIRFRR